MPATYPIQLVLEGRKCVVVGGGAVAARKAAGLIAARAHVLVVAPGVCAELASESGCTIVREPYSPNHLEHAELVFACTDDPQVNRQVAEDARARRIWCNVADHPEQCDFYASAVVRRGRLQVAVGTGGRSPEAARAIRQRLEKLLPDEAAVLVDQLAALRERIKGQVPSADARRALYRRLCQADSIERIRTHGVAGWQTWFEQMLQRFQSPELPE